MAGKREIIVDRIEFITSGKSPRSILHRVPYLGMRYHWRDIEAPELRFRLNLRPIAMFAGGIMAVRCGETDLEFEKTDYSRSRAKAIAAFIEFGTHPDEVQS